MDIKKLEGFDAYLPEEIIKDSKLPIGNDIEKLKGKAWEAITINHTLEHVKDPMGLLRELKDTLMPRDGKILIRIPVIDSEAFKRYGTNWVQFDAPRHINLFSRKSIIIAIKKAGLEVEKMYDDSNHFGFTGSERYKKGLSLKSNTFIKRLLNPNTYKYTILSRQLNKVNQGDQIVLIVKEVLS